MSPSRTTRLLLWLALLPQLVLGLGLGRGLVLCFEASGEVRIEVPDGDCCPGEAAGGARATASAPEELPDCGSCSDVRVVVDPRLTRGPEDPLPEPAQLPAALAPTATSVLTPPGVAPPRCFASVRVPPRLALVRCVELRC